MNFYNEHDRNAAAWIEELISVGEIADGFVDSRDVQLLGPDDHFEQYDQAHFFAGIGGWPHALDCITSMPTIFRRWKIPRSRR